jgi:hypothetical protein
MRGGPPVCAPVPQKPSHAPRTATLGSAAGEEGISSKPQRQHLSVRAGAAVPLCCPRSLVLRRCTPQTDGSRSRTASWCWRRRGPLSSDERRAPCASPPLGLRAVSVSSTGSSTGRSSCFGQVEREQDLDASASSESSVPLYFGGAQPMPLGTGVEAPGAAQHTRPSASAQRRRERAWSEGRSTPAQLAALGLHAEGSAARTAGMRRACRLAKSSGADDAFST